MTLRFRIIAIALLLWNLAGLAAFVLQARSNPQDLGDPITAQAFATMPAWAWTAYAVATISGTAASIALLLRHQLAWVLFAISLLGIVLQFGWSIFGFGIVQYKGAGALAFPLIIAVLAMSGMLYARVLGARHE
jgi:hypothetical protein